MTKKLLEDQIYQVANFLNPYFYKFGFTPNMLTGLSFLFMILSMLMFYKDYRILAVIFYIINYYFDCADGSMARKYNIVSNLGDFLDHFTDVIGIILLLLVLYFKNKKNFVKLIPLGIIIILILLNDLGCAEIKKQKNNKDKSNTLNFTKYFCFIRSPKYLYFFNTSTIMVFICFIILYY